MPQKSTRRLGAITSRIAFPSAARICSRVGFQGFIQFDLDDEQIAASRCAEVSSINVKAHVLRCAGLCNAIDCRYFQHVTTRRQAFEGNVCGIGQTIQFLTGCCYSFQRRRHHRLVIAQNLDEENETERRFAVKMMIYTYRRLGHRVEPIIRRSRVCFETVLTRDQTAEA
jgi:hypothetical protein